MGQTQSDPEMPQIPSGEKTCGKRKKGKTEKRRKMREAHTFFRLMTFLYCCVLPEDIEQDLGDEEPYSLASTDATGGHRSDIEVAVVLLLAARRCCPFKKRLRPQRQG
ncbi:hypothetical protein SKAU_G00010850 [Synaphobranchus kaupii]|uniref:Uncharacterized protein n=1 Tax=Synaphobranchus kaupii TaxID=118154 RepID=A0A9Q1JDB6_SYNKA|nr:hypothetical protein SKAU_G00010850 [Synaphobranchus kaupii]